MSKETSSGPMPYQVKPGSIPIMTMIRYVVKASLAIMIVYAFCGFMAFLEIGRYQLIELHSGKEYYQAKVFDTKTGKQKDCRLSNYYWE